MGERKGKPSYGSRGKTGCGDTFKPIKIIAAIKAYFTAGRSMLGAGKLLGVSAEPIILVFKDYGIYKKAIRGKRKQRLCKKCGTNITPYGKGKVCNTCQGLMMRGERHHNWTGGADNPLLALRRCAEMTEWKKAVHERDDWTCLICGTRGGKLNAHHILPLRDRQDLAYVVSNGITLCEQHHRPTIAHEYEYAQLLLCLLERRKV